MNASSNSELLVGLGESGLAAVCAPSGSTTEADRRRLLSALGGQANLHRCTKNSAQEAWIAGRFDEIETVARNLGLPADLPPERIVLEGRHRIGDALYAGLRGSFLILLWEPDRCATVAVVDQLGSQSPYVRRDGDRVYLATDAQILRALCPRPLEADVVGTVHWLVSDAPPVGRTLFEGVERPLGGTYLTISAGGIRRTTYWKPQYHDPPPLSVEEASQLLWDALRTSVGRRLAGVKHAGIIMSGGVDSTSVAAAATTLPFERPAAYSAVFPGHRVDESSHIDAVVEDLDLASVQATIEPVGAFALSVDYLERWSLPATGAGYLIEYPLLAEAAADGVTAVLDGQGGDELFAVSGFVLADLVAQGRLLYSARLTHLLPGARGRSRRQLFDAWRYYTQGGLIPYELHAALKRGRARRRGRSSWLTAASFELLVDTDHSLEWKRSRDAPRWWAHKAYLLTRARELVRIADYLRERATMAGLEAAPPLLDVDLVEAALRIPPQIEFDPDLDRPLIRRATRGLIPDSVRLSVRKSNLAPFYFDVASRRDLPAMRAVLDAPNLRIGCFVDEQAVRNLAHTPASTSAPQSWAWQCDMWRLATVECWLRHLENPSELAALLERTRLERPAWSIHRRRMPSRSRQLTR